MNLPNKLTLLRILLIPVFLVLMSVEALGSYSVLLATAIFIGASATDALDGHIARKYNLITNFGKLMDPLADKLLVMSAMLCFVEMSLAPSYVVIIILAREFLVTSIRLIAAGEGVIIAADKLGKAKTVVQMVWIITTLSFLGLETAGILPESQVLMLYPISQVLMYLALALTLISGFNYVRKNKTLIFSEK